MIDSKKLLKFPAWKAKPFNFRNGHGNAPGIKVADSPSELGSTLVSVLNG